MQLAKIIALVLCAVLVTASISGSGFEGGSFFHGINTRAAMNTFSSDTVMLSSGDYSVPWGLMYFYLHNTVSQVTNYFQEPVDWSELFYDGTLADAVKAYSIDQAVQYIVYEYGFDINGVALSDMERENLRLMLDEVIADAGGAEILEADLQLEGFSSLSVYQQWLENYVLQDKLPSVMYGDDYSGISDDAVADYAARNGYMQAAHILFVFPSEQDGYSPQEIEDARAASYEELEIILSQLNARKNDADFISYFKELAAQRSEDPGKVNYPDGYLFQFADMVEPFSAACESLDYGQMSGIVETSYGYHIILRLPLDFDSTVPVGISNSGQSYTLRQLAVFDDFENSLFSWLDALVIDYSPELQSLDVAEMFVWHD